MAKETGGGGETPRAVVGRLSLYLRQLELLERAGAATVSSRQLGAALELSDAQVRKDLANFGQFGFRGIGYPVTPLRAAVRAVLGVDRKWRAAVIGAGNLGRALLGYRGFQERGFEICAVFDNDASVVGKKVRGREVWPMEKMREVVRRERVELALIAVPAEAAQSVATEAAAAGVAGILNFAPVTLKVEEAVNVVNVDLGLQLEQLVFQVHQRATEARQNTAG